MAPDPLIFGVATAALNTPACLLVRAARMQTTLLLLALAQVTDLVTWTDSSGVVHVATRAEAPRTAKPLEGEISVISPDSRPAVLPDGGTRDADTASWRARLRAAHAELSRLVAVESAASRAVSSANQRTCVTATATAVARVPARVTRRGELIRQPVEQSSTSTQTACTETSASPEQQTALASARAERVAAETALRQLEREATAAGVPLRDQR
jgi:hypothetical protein